MKTVRTSFFVCILLLTIGPAGHSASAQTQWAHPYDNAVVVSVEEQATRAGLEILQYGGNAVDAAVAVQFALAVTLPRAGNIGGGGFMILRLNDGTTRALDFREKAPEYAHRDMFLNENGEYIEEWSRKGSLASGVPGTVDGMITALEYYGRLPLEVVMEPAIRLAGHGYELSFSQALELNDSARALAEFPSSRKYFLKEDGSPWREGDLFIQQDLAQTLKRISQNGRNGFYAGSTARQIVMEMRRNGGLIDYEDLQNYRSVWRDPLRATYQDYELIMMPPPSSGGFVIQQVLGMLQGENLQEKGFNSADYVHLVSEALRRSFADRNYYLGDPDYTDVPLDELTDEAYYRDRMAGFDPAKTTPSENVSHGELYHANESSETTHFSVMDADGNAVSVTTTLNGNFGSKLAVDGAGFLLNNEMDDFSAKPGEPSMFGLIGAEANSIESGKRMLSSMSPAIVTKNGNVRMVLGAAGGPRIITATLQNFLNMALFDMNAVEAVGAPRFHHQWLPDVLTVEPFAITMDTEEILLNRGHLIEKMDVIGRSHIIQIDEEGRKTGAADPRSSGVVAGY